MEEGGKSFFHVLGERKVGAPARRGPRWPGVCRASTWLSPERRDRTEAGPLLRVPSHPPCPSGSCVKQAAPQGQAQSWGLRGYRQPGRPDTPRGKMGAR